MEKESIEKAVCKLKRKINEEFGKETEVYLFGSVARRDYETDSDIDILVLVPVVLNNSIEEDIFNLAYDIELEYDVVFGIIVYSKEFWHSNLGSTMPLYESIQKEGTLV